MDNVEKVMKLIDTFPEPRRTRVKEMMDGHVGETYFTAPASSRESFHAAYPGGLCQHSLNVVGNLWRLCKDLCPGRYDNATLSFVGLFHDLGKVGDGDVERYIPNGNSFQRTEYGKLYVINPEMKYMSTAEGGLFILQKYGLELGYDEYLAIRLSDGQYDPANADYKMKEPELALLLHWSDIWSCKAEKAAAS